LLPSIVEGFGLPIVESIWHGRKTFASDTPIHREVGGEHCEYFALHDPQDLAQRIENWERAIRSVDSRTSAHTLASNLNAERFVPTTWAESTSELIDAVLDAYQSSPFRQPGPLTTPALPSLRSMPSAT
jgi:alpha-1,2-rhamnosyltransferase